MSLNSGCSGRTSFCCFSVSGPRVLRNPVWTTKPFTTRWNDVPSSTPALASRRNARTCSGALSGKNSIVIGPSGGLEHGAVGASVSGVSVLNGSGSGGGVSRIATDTISMLGRHPFRRRRRLRDLLDDVHALGDAAEDRVLAGQRRLIGHADEELRPAAVGLARLQHRRHRAARRRLAADLGLQHTQPAGAVQLRLRRILRQRIAALDDAQPDHAVKGRSVVGPFAGELHEVADMIRREIRAQVDHERPSVVSRPPACWSSRQAVNGGAGLAAWARRRVRR